MSQGVKQTLTVWFMWEELSLSTQIGYGLVIELMPESGVLRLAGPDLQNAGRAAVHFDLTISLG
ncbi:hypothetical protein D7S44_21315 [Pantoea piersonii]|jgi:hypothetical protein|nr:hypothetical protein D7S44_21315 [Pantoea piersonii]